MDTFSEFLNNKNAIVDVFAEEKVVQMNLYCQQLLDEIRRLETRVQSLHITEQELIAIEATIAKTKEENTNLLNQNTELRTNCIQKEGELASLVHQIKEREKELTMFTDLTKQIVQLEAQKQDILLFTEQNQISKAEVSLITDQLELLRRTQRDMQITISNLSKEITQKEAQSQLLDRDMEQANKILEEAKHLKAAADSTFEQIKIIEEQKESLPGSIGAYIKKLQKKHPNIDFLNVV